MSARDIYRFWVAQKVHEMRKLEQLEMLVNPPVVPSATTNPHVKRNFALFLRYEKTQVGIVFAGIRHRLRINFC